MLQSPMGETGENSTEVVSENCSEDPVLENTLYKITDFRTSKIH